MTGDFKGRMPARGGEARDYLAPERQRVARRSGPAGWGIHWKGVAFWAGMISLAVLLGLLVLSATGCGARIAPRAQGFAIAPRTFEPVGQSARRIDGYRVDPASRHLLVHLVEAADPQGPGAWMTAAGLDGLAAVAIKVASDGTLATGADPGGPIASCAPTCVVIGGLNGLSPVALKVGADGTVATSGGVAGSVAFSGVTAGTNANALVIGTGGSLTVSGSGTINATALNGTAFTGTSTHLVAFGASNIPVDSGIVDTAAGLLAACTGCAPLVSPSFTTPALGTPSSGTLTNATGLPINGVVSATGAIATVANGNNPLVINCALTSGTTCLTTGETTAASTAGAVEQQITTLNSSTAIPLQVTEGNGANATATPLAVNVVGGVGGPANGVTNPGQKGGGITLTTGAGSIGGATSGTGGAGGALNLTGGAGGAATAGSTTGAGGDIILTPGAAGGTGTAGRGGEVQVVGPTMGAATAAPFLQVTGTWNTTGVVDAALLVNVTNTASGAVSKLMDLQIAGTTFFYVDKGGNAVAATAVNSPAYQTKANCAAAGTAANPSVASCAAAASGSFSCATNASGGTCQVNTTAVNANSDIFIQEDDSLGTKLSVTCNTNLISPATAPIAARSAGASFTINLGTITTNPECFSYFIIN